MSTEQALKNSYIYVGILLLLEGFLFLVFPNLTTKLLLLAPLQTAQAEQYARVTGLAVCVIGYYYYMAGKYTAIDFFRASVVGRLFILPIILLMIYVWSVELPLIVFGIQDLVTAFWSYTCLKAYDAEQAKIKK